MRLTSQMRGRIRAHCCWFADLPEVTVASAACTDKQIQDWSAEMLDRDYANEPQTRTGEVA